MVLGSALGPGVSGLLIDRGVGIETQFVGVAAYFCMTTLLMFVGITRAARDLPHAQTQAEIRMPQP
jgi:hypothetical protein